MKEFKRCGDCVHFLVCCNVYTAVDKDTVIENVNGEPCYYYSDDTVPRTLCDELMKAYKRTLDENKELREEIENWSQKHHHGNGGWGRPLNIYRY